MYKATLIISGITVLVGVILIASSQYLARANYGDYYGMADIGYMISGFGAVVLGGIYFAVTAVLFHVHKRRLEKKSELQ